MVIMVRLKNIVFWELCQTIGVQ